ncbi:hypothetical protein ABT294_40310 [Nonomuraea sp. NPDC000554]|uniref:hypothetical protein n=1 Tax=Nonomuraea sp. NPDC000554 TaxID=3154259 RepID=UPI00332EC232
MPKFQDASLFAASIAPVIDAVHVNVHASARRAGADLATASGLEPGVLIDLRFTLPLRPITRHGLATLYRYADPSGLEPEIQAHLAQGTLEEDADGVLRATPRTLAFLDALYALHAEAIGRIWNGRDLTTLADLVGRVLDQAAREPGGALEVMAPPYEPDGSPAGLLLFNRLAALRYHRADAHAAAWRAAGLSSREIVALRDGLLREAVEADTNRRASRPYLALSADDREALHDGLLALV